MGEGSCHTVRIPQQYSGEDHLMRMLKHLSSPHGEEGKPSPNDPHYLARHVSVPSAVKSAEKLQSLLSTLAAVMPSTSFLSPGLVTQVF